MLSKWLWISALLAFIEVLRRVILILLYAYTGPLSKIPGPTINKFSLLPWRFAVLRGVAFQRAQDLHKRYGDIIRVAPNLVIVADKTSVHKVLVELDFPKSPIYEKYRQDANAAALFTIRDKAKYRQRRRLLANGFSISYLKGVEPLMLDCIKALIEVIDAQCDVNEGHKTRIDFYNVLSSLASDVMSECSFGGSFGLVRNGQHPLRSRITNYLRRAAMHQIIPFAKLIPFLPPVQDEEMDKMIYNILDRREAQENKLARRDLLQILLEAHAESPETVTKRDVKAEMIVFLLAGSETSSTSTTFILLFLLNDPTRLKLVMDEIMEKFPLRDHPVTHENTRSLPYLNAVISESLRLMPPAAGGFARQAVETCTFGDYVIPAGTLVTANTTTLQKDPREWPDPELFVPERWLRDYKGVPAAEKSYYPFSAGSRVCIGKQFALMELRLVLVTLLRRYEISLVPGQSHEVTHFSVLHLKAGKYFIDFKPRS